MNPLIIDAEIKNGIATETHPALPGYTYAQNWSDYQGMGIATLCAFNTQNARAHVFMDDNLSALQQLINDSESIVGFNNHQFDDPLLAAHGLLIPKEKSIDLAAIIWCAAGIPSGEHPKGLGLDAICRANGITGKTGDGALAPILYQDGQLGQLIDYCLGDVYATLRLYRKINLTKGITDPRTGQWLHVVAP